MFFLFLHFLIADCSHWAFLPFAVFPFGLVLISLGYCCLECSLLFLSFFCLWSKSRRLLRQVRSWWSCCWLENSNQKSAFFDQLWVYESHMGQVEVPKLEYKQAILWSAKSNLWVYSFDLVPQKLKFHWDKRNWNSAGLSIYWTSPSSLNTRSNHSVIDSVMEHWLAGIENSWSALSCLEDEAGCCAGCFVLSFECERFELAAAAVSVFHSPAFFSELWLTWSWDWKNCWLGSTSILGCGFTVHVMHTYYWRGWSHWFWDIAHFALSSAYETLHLDF